VKRHTSPLVMAGVALTLGAAGGVVSAMLLGTQRDQRTQSDSEAAVPSLIVEQREIAQRLDRSLLRLAEREQEREPTDVVGGPGTAAVAVAGGAVEAEAQSLTEQRDQLYRLLSYELGVPQARLSQIRAIIETLPYTGQGNPEVTVHPLTREQCRSRRSAAAIVGDDEGICGAPNMVALFDPEHEEPKQARLCIDQFEFPNVPCEYPLVWVRASDAARICRLLDKRLCDAHEWEGACAGKILPPRLEYEGFIDRLNAEFYHNQRRERVWAMGYQPDARTCGTGALKSPGCEQPSWERCGSNTYPSGAFPRCVSPFGVYDLHGNVAEHMNLPLNETQLGARGGHGQTEMKGSWFGADAYHPHPDDCRWRAPAWHATSVLSAVSHYNYHLGFRCCRDLD
jgi:formylglycine-generating enzyme